MPDISVVIPTCDRPAWLQRALQSVRAQSHAPCEIIVVDNGSTPLDAESLPDEITLVRMPPRSGAGVARNTGADRARGAYIAFLDDDDEWRDDYLEQMARAIEGQLDPADMLIGNMVDDSGQPCAILPPVGELLQHLLVENPGTGGPNTVVRRAAFLDVGGYDPGLVASEDRGLAMDFILADKMLLAVPEAVAVIHREHGGHLSKSPAMLEGTRAFCRKYNHLMDRRARRLNQAKLLALSASRNRDRNWVLSKIQRLGARLLKRVAGHSAATEPEGDVARARSRKASVEHIRQFRL